MIRLSLTTLLFAIAAPIGAAIAQTAPPRTLTLRIDNDAFNFWTMPWDRPDGEYTSGVHITVDGAPTPWWASRFFRRRAPCTTGARECHTASAELGQDIYTPSLRASDPVPPANARPNAGWLYVSQTARWLTEHRADEFTVTLGVTGRPSLARFTQRLAHSAAPEFNRPVDWSREIGFEPGAIVRYDQRRRIAAHDGIVGIDLVQALGASVGNVTTAAETGLRSRVGVNLRHPWLPVSNATELALVGGVSGSLVLRDMFLDGNTFHPQFSVGHRPFVGSGELGIELRHRVVTLAYRAVTTSQTYVDGPKWHPWSSMVGGVTFAR